MLNRRNDMVGKAAQQFCLRCDACASLRSVTGKKSLLGLLSVCFRNATSPARIIDSPARESELRRFNVPSLNRPLKKRAPPEVSLLAAKSHASKLNGFGDLCAAESQCSELCGHGGLVSVHFGRELLDEGFVGIEVKRQRSERIVANILSLRTAPGFKNEQEREC